MVVAFNGFVVLDTWGLTRAERIIIGVIALCALWTIVWYAIFLIARKIFVVLWPPEKSADGEWEALQRKSTSAPTDMPLVGKGEKEDMKAGVRMFCYTCAAMRSGEAEETNDLGGFTVHLGVYCTMCGTYLVDQEWLPHLVAFFNTYDNDNYKGVNPKFPLNHFVTPLEIIGFLLTLLTTLVNIGTIVYKVVLAPDRDVAKPYNSLLILLPWTEVCACIVVAIYICWVVGRKLTSQRVNKVQRPLSTFMASFLPEFPSLADVNAVGMVRLWNFSTVVDGVTSVGYFRCSAPAPVMAIFNRFFFVASIPAMFIIFSLPALGILARLIQLGPALRSYIGDWPVLHWITLLSLFNNIRSAAEKPQPLSMLVKHLVGSRMSFPFIDIADRTAAWFKVSVLHYTSTPQEIYRILVVNEDRIFLPTDETARRRSSVNPNAASPSASNPLNPPPSAVPTVPTQAWRSGGHDARTPGPTHVPRDWTPVGPVHRGASLMALDSMDDAEDHAV